MNDTHTKQDPSYYRLTRAPTFIIVFVSFVAMLIPIIGFFNYSLKRIPSLVSKLESHLPPELVMELDLFLARMYFMQAMGLLTVALMLWTLLSFFLDAKKVINNIG